MPIVNIQLKRRPCMRVQSTGLVAVTSELTNQERRFCGELPSFRVNSGFSRK